MELSKKVIFSCFIAGALEMYDFAIFGFLSGIIHKNYLVFINEGTALIVTYALFAVGFVFRPIGSLIFGYIGDKFGRKKALVLSITFMGFASLLMSLLPPYSAIGITSCYLIALIRAIQGISVGGEYSGALIYAVEHSSKNKAGLVSGIVVSGCVCGVLLATLVSKILQNPLLPEYSWRFAFLIGFGLSIVGYIIRKNLIETPEFLKVATNKVKIPLIKGIKAYPLQCLATIFTSASNGVNFYFILVFLPNYVNKVTGLVTINFPIITNIILVFFGPLFAYISDKISRIKVISVGLCSISIFIFLGLNNLINNPSNLNAYIFFIGQALLYSISTSTINVFIIELFPVQYRFSCSSICYSLGLGIIGGTSPLIASLIYDNFANHAFYISLYVSAMSIIGFITVYLIGKKQHHSVL